MLVDPHSCPSINFVFVSPQFMVRHEDVLEAHCQATDRKNMFMDEGHFYVHHGEVCPGRSASCSKVSSFALSSLFQTVTARCTFSGI